MYTGIYKIADVIIEINSIYDEVQFLCQDYKCDEIPDVIINITASDIEFENEKSIKEARIEGKEITNYSPSYLEILAVYRKIAISLLDYNVLLFHGSVVAVNEQGYLFTAKSGVGKTTHSRLWVENIPGAYIVNGDKPLLRISDDNVIAYGTPWRGKEGYGINDKVILKSICLIERGENNHIESVDDAFFLPYIIQQSYRPNDSKYMLKTMQLIEMLIKSTCFYVLHCNMNADAAVLSYEVMQKK